MLSQLRTEFDKILDEKCGKVADLIKRAVESGVHVDILVTSKPAEVLAWEYFERLGFPKGTSEYAHVESAAQPPDRPSLRIRFQATYE